MPVPRRRLGNTSLEVSTIGFGSSSLGAVFDPTAKESEGIEAVHEAFRQGINYFDVAPFYGLGKAEEVLGKAISTLPRNEIVISTKVGRYDKTLFDFSAARTSKSIQESLRRLNVDYVDLIQIHDIEFSKIDQLISETIPALMEAKQKGLVKYIGITGLPLKVYSLVLDRVEIGTIDTILTYCHHTLFDDSMIQQLPYFKSKKVGVINAAVLSMGLLSGDGPPPWHPAPQEIKDYCTKAREHCKERGIKLHKLAIYHSIQEPGVDSTLVGMGTPDQVLENVEIANLTKLSPEEEACLREVKEILMPVRNKTWPSGYLENNGDEVFDGDQERKDIYYS